MGFHKIIWAVDPLQENGHQRQGFRILHDFSKKTKARIQPVYVLSDGLLNLSIKKTDLVNQFKDVSQKALNNLAKQGGISKMAAPTVLVSAPSSRSKAAHALDLYARNKKADLILVNSHGRHGLKRAVFGSFAETLALHSKTPILISGPKTKHLSELKHILFPTDFSRQSKKAFKKALGLAKRLGARITVFYVAVNTLEPFVQSGAGLLGGGYVSTRGYVNQDVKIQRQLAKKWIAEAKKHGVVADTFFDLDSTSITISILKYAKRKKPGLIAMASESGPVSAAVLGSVGRGVAREAPCPVWFFHA